MVRICSKLNLFLAYFKLNFQKFITGLFCLVGLWSVHSSYS